MKPLRATRAWSAGRAYMLASPFHRFILILPLFMLLAMGVFVFLTYREAQGALLDEFRVALREEITNLEMVYREEGLEALRESIDRRTSLGEADHTIYLLTEPGGQRLAGNLWHWPAGVPVQDEHSVTFADPISGNTVAAEVFLLYGNYRLLVGRRAIYEQVGEHLLRNYLWLSSAVILAALACGWAFTRLIRRRLGAIAGTARAIRNEATHARIPVGNSGDEIDALIVELNAMLDKQDKLLLYARQSSFAIAHDLRHPLSHLRNELSEVADELRATPQGERVDRLIEDVNRILSVFGALLRLGRLESGTQVLTRRPLALDTFAADVVSLYAPLAEEAGRSVVVRAAPCTAQVDRELLGQALANLMENALRYGQGDIMVRVVQYDDHVLLGVRDHGPGIPSAAVPRVIEPFVRLETSRHSPGSGLGLALVKAIVEAHGGELQLLPAQPGLDAVMLLPSSPF
ncbi:two-component sensor histidine kinase [Chitiniphilus shinanonensis]|uniref:histidine kinase n=1 Tax=Chitiniphilus shinanonensis TaxID=553088 RepID=A0ABQ6BVS1_9NEIS|nr:HAMP domain-containing sensor histidine kinase [Chitiniphilus shinanonensis]GLS03864.1 two-component sensor histidine kinase [Chitiniphilus shinanonensis]